MALRGARAAHPARRSRAAQARPRGRRARRDRTRLRSGRVVCCAQTKRGFLARASTAATHKSFCPHNVAQRATSRDLARMSRKPHDSATP